MFILIFLLISSTYFLSAEDCGCNKLNRNELKNIKIDNQNRDEIIKVEDNVQKVCQLPSKKSTKYRDYYSEENQNEEIIDGMSFIPGGNYFIGTNEPYFAEDKESPERIISIKDFYMDKFEISNKKFEEFVKATGFITEAERLGDSFLFKSLLSADMQQKYVDFRVVSAPWWYKVDNVTWRRPNGPDSDLVSLLNHPVVHVTWNDAVEYCKWANKRLPTEIEWEVACRGNKKHKLFPWGNKLMPRDEHWLNIWQGEFPDRNTLDDGYEFTCPVDKFHQNIFDMYNIVGNVWEWTQDLWIPGDTSANPNRVKKGGSYLCNKSYCYRYRCAARSQNTADSSAGNLGFRCAKDF